MKRFILLGIIVAMTGSLYAQKKAHQYALKSGYVSYKLTGSTKGTKELWWDDYGNKTYELEKSKSVTKMFGMSRTKEVHQLTVTNDGNAWTVDYIKNKAIQTRIPRLAKSFNNDMSEEEQKKMADNILQGFGGRKLGTQKILGYTCEGVTVFGSKTWVYKGVPLKTNAKILGIEHNAVATTFKPNASVSASKFAAPKGFKFEKVGMSEQQNLMNALNENMDDDEAEEEEEKEMVPVEYPAEKFKSKVDAFQYNGYTKFMCNQNKDGYSAMFMKGMSGMIAVVAVSKDNPNKSEVPKDKWFIHGGKKYMYHVQTKEGQKIALLVEDIKAHDTYIIFTAKPMTDKASLLKIADKFNF